MFLVDIGNQKTIIFDSDNKLGLGVHRGNSDYVLRKLSLNNLDK